MGAPKVSVIMPVYNTEEYVGEAIDSVLTQSLDDLELICVDDGSTDGSFAILQGYAARDPRVHVLAQENAGAGAARNLGLKHATGAYLAFLDSDDFYEPGMLEAMFSRCEEDGADLCICNGRIFHQDTGDFEYPSHYLVKDNLPSERPFSRHDIPDKILMFATCVPWNKLFSRSFVEGNGLLFQGTRNSNDVYFDYMALALAERITVCPEVLVTYRKGHSGHLQASKDLNPFDFYDALLALKDGLERAGVFTEVERSFANRALSDVEYNLGSMNTAEGYLRLYRMLRDEGLEKLGLLQHDREYYFDQRRYDRVSSIAADAPAIKLFGNAELYAEDIRGLNDGVLLDVSRIAVVPQGGGVKVSVIMPVYNTEMYVAEAIDSVLSQSLEDLELICVDDGSTDGSLAILHEYEARDPRVRVLSQENAGPGAARNAALRIATGEYVAFLDSDDLLEPEALQTLYAYAKSCDLDELFFTSSVFYENEEVERNTDFHPSYAYKNLYPGSHSGRELFVILVQNWDLKDPVCLQILKKDFLEREGIAFREGIIHEDALITVECLALAQQVRILDIPLHRRRVRAGSIMTDASRFNSAYGYFICMREALEFAKERGLDEDREYLGALTVRLNRLRSSAANELAMLEEQDIQERLALLSDDDYAGFKLLIYDQMPKRQAKNAASERRALNKLEKDQLYLRLAARVDVKDTGGLNNDVEVLELSDLDARMDAPDWFCDEQGTGHVLESTAGSLDVRLRCIGAGELAIILRGQYVRDAEGNFIPAWIDYTSFSVDGRELLGGTRAVWHNKPFKHRMPVTDGQVVDVSLTWHSHDEAGLEAEQERVDALNSQIRALKGENASLQKAEKKQEKELAAAAKELATAEDEVLALRSSNSWKIGRFITWLPRKIKALFRRLRGR